MNKKTKKPAENTNNDISVDIIKKLTNYGFVVMPLENKRPILKAWNHLEKTPERLYIFKNRNLGLVCGKASGITILDIDIKNNGLEVWKHLSSSYPEFKTPMVETPSGGLHLYFRYNKKIHSFSSFTLRGKQVGWDLLNNDRQAVLPPSINTITKRKYKWVISPDETDFIQIPQWLENYLLHCKSFN